jgi:tripartite-type tricarboxylate transporter receptor subunit TctC
METAIMGRSSSRCRKALAALLLACGAAGAGAQDFPTRPIKLIVPYAAGQGTDVAARFVAERLAREIGGNIVVENRAGAGGNIGTQLAAKAPADGYTLLMGTNGTHAAAEHLYANPGFNADADFEPIALTGVLPLAIVTRPDNPVENVSKLVAAAQAQPNKINVAVTTTTSRSVFELFKQRAQAPLFPVSYKGSAQAITDLIGGQVDYLFDTVASTRAQITGGNLKALAISSLNGSELLPGVKSIAEQGVAGFEIVGWNAIYAPKGTPPEVVRKLAAATTRVMRLPETREKLLQIGLDPRTLAGDELVAFLREERDKWGQVIRSANLKVE